MKTNRVSNIVLTIYVALIFAFVFAPIIFSMIFSFNSQRFPTIPLGSFTTEWYQKILADPDVWEAALNSLIVSCSTAVIATFLGFCTAYSDYRYNFRFKGPYLALILLPPTIPSFYHIPRAFHLDVHGLTGCVIEHVRPGHQPNCCV